MYALAAILVAFFGLISPIAAAAEKMPTDLLTGAELRAGLIEYLADHGYEGNPAINQSRLFRPCEMPLAYRPMFGNMQTVEIICPDADGWKLAIRTKVGASPSKKRKKIASLPLKVGQTVAYLVARQSLKRGHIITASDLKIAEGSVKGFSDYYNSVDALVGRKLKRRLGIGKMVRASYIEANWLVSEGQPVTLTSQFGGVEVVSEGKALENAQWGEVARFLNVRSGREVFATVISEKKVIIGANKF
ncbi:MAG: flagellar basal body P-ring formation protein FlgA [Alphaproteobacteria bacterium]|nr:flagellar basal body P-ring formation protein FlgA [Alphaproteobacteria bacterium]MBL6777051.1 flagellar basal body P-ring formation protein FlgA [Alphaproteobacteria bacterium]